MDWLSGGAFATRGSPVPSNVSSAVYGAPGEKFCLAVLGLKPPGMLPVNCSRTLMAPVAAGLVTSAVFTPALGLIVNMPAPGLTASAENDGCAVPSVSVVEPLIGRTLRSLTEIAAIIWGGTPEATARALALTRRFVIRKMRVPVPGGLTGTPKNVTALGTEGLNCPVIIFGAWPSLKSRPVLPPTPMGAGVAGKVFSFPAPAGNPGSSISRTAS